MVLKICGSFQTDTCCILMYIPKPFKYHDVINTLLINKQENIVKDVANQIYLNFLEIFDILYNLFLLLLKSVVSNTYLSSFEDF